MPTTPLSTRRFSITAITPFQVVRRRTTLVFFFKIWDQLAGTEYPASKCFCVRCEQKKGKRTRAIFDKVIKPDYSVLLSPGFWFNADVMKFDKTTNSVMKEKEEAKGN